MELFDQSVSFRTTNGVTKVRADYKFGEITIELPLGGPVTMASAQDAANIGAALTLFAQRLQRKGN